MAHPYRSLLSLIENRAGGATRGVGYYTEDAMKLLYTREDLRTDQFLGRAETIMTEARGREPLMADDGKLGSRLAGLELYEEAVLIHFIKGKGQGLVISVEPVVAQRLADFVAECNLALSPDDESRYESN